ncbi:MAG: M48 family metallopeptidase [Candidatus Aenigmarchaeota archaeon]|nr:M48 family metallopeptidase [Candidatus Aenigmarchaeota archaeon]
MAQKVLLEDQISRNKQKTVLICLFMLGLMFALVFSIAWVWGVPTELAALIAFPVALFYVLMSYSFSVQSVIAATKARPADPKVRAEKLLIYKVEEIAIASGMPKPKVYIQDSKDINAFATGKNPDESVICVTTGALEQLKGEELEGVIAHEMSHIMNRDILLATVTIGVVGAIALISEILLRSFIWGGGNSDRNKGSGALILVGILFAILAPIFAKLTYLAISRNREYLADASGARLSRNPEGLAKALEKIKADLPDHPVGSKTAASLYIANPFLGRNVSSIWATHPPIDERIKRLREM